MIRLWRDQNGGKWIQRGNQVALIVAADAPDPDTLHWEEIRGAVAAYGLRKVWGAW